MFSMASEDFCCCCVSFLIYTAVTPRIAHTRTQRVAGVKTDNLNFPWPTPQRK
jgi:hypothetical protein